MNTRPIDTQSIRSSSDALSDSDLNAVVGGQEKFQYVERDGSTYAVGHIHGQTVMVKVT